MKKRIALICIGILLFLGTVGYFVLHATKPTPTLPPNPTPTSAVDEYCTPTALQTQVNLSPGAGNIYGTFTLKNISQASCKILGGEFIAVHFDSTIKNIAITHIGQIQKDPFAVQPGQTIYSQIHYPNGPQCQSVGLTSVPVTFTYQISPTQVVSFTSIGQQIKPIVQACKNPTDITTIEIWNMAIKPITQ